MVLWTLEQSSWSFVNVVYFGIVNPLHSKQAARSLPTSKYDYFGLHLPYELKAQVRIKK